MTLLRVGGIERYEVLHSVVLYQNGCFTRTKYWLRGWHPNLPYSRRIMGWSGKETEYISETITGRETWTSKKE